ncbi:MAG: DUF1934 domain-containing protein [Clostridia bacterium]|nr:DUF1934 domain-containing protein [Clostridia bacterium]MBN2882470.1 DUF1934 domain-containing protein [Clostridia bacterium]
MKKVIVSVRGKGSLEEGEPMELLTEGKFYKENNIFCISYEETGMTGMEGTTTTVRAEENRVALSRKGTVASEFIFEEGRKNVSHYATEYGVFTVGVTAEQVNVSIDDSGGMISVVYSLDFLGNPAVRNEFILTVREVGNERYN